MSVISATHRPSPQQRRPGRGGGGGGGGAGGGEGNGQALKIEPRCRPAEQKMGTQRVDYTCRCPRV